VILKKLFAVISIALRQMPACSVRLIHCVMCLFTSSFCW